MLTLLAAYHEHLFVEEGHSERVSGVVQRQKERLEGGHGCLGASRPPTSVEGQLVVRDSLAHGDVGRRSDAGIQKHGPLQLLQQPVVVGVPLEYAAAELLRKRTLEGVGFTCHAKGDAAHEMSHNEPNGQTLPRLEARVQLRCPHQRAAIAVGIERQGTLLACPPSRSDR